MIKIRSFILVFLMYNVPVFGSSIPNEPVEVVKYAFTALTNGEIDKLIDVTANSELRQVNELLTSIKANPSKKDSLLKQYQNLKSWQIDNSQAHKVNGRNIYVVSTTWVVNVPIEKKSEVMKGMKDPNKSDHTVFMDYMLEQLDGRWKIISRRSI
ncbi:MAG: hypothetical protein ACRCTQ_05420 [Brevinemataceae bacterium]